MAILDKVKMDGITFIDIDKRHLDWSFPDYNCDRVPNKGDVMSLEYIDGNDHNYYYGEVLYVIDSRVLYDLNENIKRMQDCEIKSHSISVVLREIKGPLGEETYNTILKGINGKN